ncbi:prolyl oligopeptidase family serine peptidase [Halorarius litoreus]|uniref:prolyl oligopeptidase family serine peptidase n=1 Tax=Halorarius litoreus TaxID=2962676 RepID=UPI0020CFE6B4|nr:prolyl oligopeptidase family serine peptidase [Halorarius litoreus]
MSADDAGPSGADEVVASTAPRPGPDALYGETPRPPLLENGPGWAAEPLLVSGCDAYVDGEYLYQDFVYDDHGADTRSLLSRQPSGAEKMWGTFAQPTGDLHYPNDPERYAYNAADLLEFRARPTDEGIAYRITLNTMLDTDVTGVAIGIDTSGAGTPEDGRTDWGYGLGDLGAPADHVLVTWGEGAELDGEPLADEAVSVDLERNQLEVEVPLDPGEETWRHYCVTGLWDADVHAFQRVEVAPDYRTPGGRRSGQDVPPVFNVGFRFHEPMAPPDLDPTALPMKLFDVLTAGLPSVLGTGNWREHDQALALRERDISSFFADIDFATLRAGETVEHVPESGYLSLLYPSRYDFGEGVDPAHDLLEGCIQPYGAYVPDDNDGTETPLTVLLHSLGNCYTQYAVYTPNLLQELGEEHGSIVLMPQARGPGLWYKREGELDVFEAWRDLETRFEIDRDRVSLAGYSMGGYGTFVLAAQYPDLFSSGFSVVGPPTEDPLEGATGGMVALPALLTRDLFGGRGGGRVRSIFSERPEDARYVTDNLRHVPLLVWNGGADVLVPVLGPLGYARRLREHGYRHELDVFPFEGHLTMAIRDRWDRAARFLDAGRVTRSPARVTYRHVPEFDHPDVGLVHDGAYWVDDITVTDAAHTGLVDAISLADGYGEPVVDEFVGAGRSPNVHKRRGVHWKSPVETQPARNALQVSLEGVETVTLWVEDAGLDPTDELTLAVDSDSAATVTLAGSFGYREVEVPEGASETTVRLAV